MASPSATPWFPPIRTFNDTDYRSREWLAAWYTQYQLARWIPQQQLPAKASTAPTGEHQGEMAVETHTGTTSSPPRRPVTKGPPSPTRGRKSSASPSRTRTPVQTDARTLLESAEAAKGKEEEIRHLQQEQMDLEQQLQKEKALSVKQEWRVKELLDEVHQLEQETATANRKRLQAERLAAARAQRERQQPSAHFLPVSPTTGDESQPRQHSLSQPPQPLVPAQPALIIDVAESEGCPSGQIEVYPGDRARDLAYRYGQLHRLDSTNVDRLEKAIQRAIDTNL
jgi:hypothetical protein